MLKMLGRGVEGGLLFILWQKHQALPIAVGTPERWWQSPAVVHPTSHCSRPGLQVSREGGLIWP